MKTITKEIIENTRESIVVEYKTAEGNLPSDFWETYSAFCNTEGGVIILGVKETKPKNIIKGVNNPDQIQRDLWNLLSNRNKVSYNALSNDDVKVITIDGKQIVLIDVPEIDFLHKPVYLGNNYKDAYIRTWDGDRKITEEQLRSFLRNARPIMDTEIAADVTLEDLDSSSIAAFKERVTARYGSRISPELSQEAFLDRINAIEYSKEGKILIKKGTLLFFGKYKSIKKHFPSYFLDYINCTVSEKRWIDRVATDDLYDIEMNVYNFYNIVFEKLRLLLSTSFDLDENLVRSQVGNLDVVLREALTNALAHADYEMQSSTIKITAHKGWISFINPGQMLISRKQFINGGKSVLRNELLMTFFRYLGLSERQGGGGPEIFETAVKNEYRLPEIETSINETELKIWHIDLAESYPELNDSEKAVFKVICKNGGPLSTKDIQKSTSMTEYATRKALLRLEEEGKIVKSGNGKSTRYLLSMSSPEAVTQLQMLVNDLQKRIKG